MTDAREREVRVQNAQKSRKVERERSKALRELEEAFRTAGMAWPPPQLEAYSACEPCEDYAGERLTMYIYYTYI